MEIKVMKNIMDANHKLAQRNRNYFKDNGITAVNMMASPGAGKTSIIIKIIEALKDSIPINVIEGDIASSIDAEKIDRMGIPVMQINTGGGCHLDANMIDAAIKHLKMSKGTILFIENVGNLVCPSAFDLGEGMRMVIASVPEGHDKPYKYTSMFQGADVIILNKSDLMEYMEFDKEFFYKGIQAVNESALVFEVSSSTGHGIDGLVEWLRSERE